MFTKKHNTGGQSNISRNYLTKMPENKTVKLMIKTSQNRKSLKKSKRNTIKGRFETMVIFVQTS